MSELNFRNPDDQEFFDLTKNFDIDDWRELRDENYYMEECPFTGKMQSRDRASRLVLIRYYVQHGVRKP